MTAKDRVQCVCGDISQLSVDAIVNAANPGLLGGGGVDGAIHAAAGPELLAACVTLPEVSPGVRCPTGEARITPGFELPARYVIHTVGPVWRDLGTEAALLAACYRNSLSLAEAHQLETVAFPAVSTGVYGFPKPLAAEIAVGETLKFLETHPAVTRAVLVSFAAQDVRHYEAALRTRG